jgi:hypothetical protein
MKDHKDRSKFLAVLLKKGLSSDFLNKFDKFYIGANVIVFSNDRFEVSFPSSTKRVIRVNFLKAGLPGCTAKPIDPGVVSAYKALVDYHMRGTLKGLHKAVVLCYQREYTRDAIAYKRHPILTVPLRVARSVQRCTTVFVETRIHYSKVEKLGKEIQKSKESAEKAIRQREEFTSRQEYAKEYISELLESDLEAFEGAGYTIEYYGVRLEDGSIRYC